MGLFGDNEDERFSQDLSKVMRKRILAEVAAKQARAAAAGGGGSVINNVYGGHATAGGGGGGVMDRLGPSMGGGEGGEDPFDYLVDITREDLPLNPETGKPGGWKKHVHRHREEKKK